MTTIADLQRQQDIPVAFYTRTIRSEGTWTCRERRFSDSLNGLDVEFLDLKQAAMQLLGDQVGQPTGQEEAWLRRADVVLAMPLDREEAPSSGTPLALPRQRTAMVLGAWPFTITGDLHLASGVRFQEHVHDYRDRFMAITNAQVTCHTAPTLSFSAPFVLVNRANIDSAGRLQAAVPGELHPAESVGGALVAGGFPLDLRGAAGATHPHPQDDHGLKGEQPPHIPAESRGDASRVEQPLPGPSWLQDEWAGQVEASVARAVASAPAAPRTPAWTPQLSPLPQLCGSAVDLPSSSAAAVLAASRLFRPQDEPLLQRFCKRLADEASLFPGRTLAGRQFRAGELLFSSGQRGDVLFVVAHGTVQVLSAPGPGRQERHGEYRGPGDLLGEMTVLGDGVHPSTARALTDTMTLVIRTATLSLLMQRFPRVTTRILDFVRSRATHLVPSLV